MADAALDIEALYQRHRVPIYRAVAGVVFDDAVAEDITQETFEKAWRARRAYRGDHDDGGAWLYRIAMNGAKSWLRRQRLARLLPTRIFLGPDTSQEGVERVETRQLADVALAVLSPKLRAVVVLAYYSDLTQQDIASALGIPRGTVASRLSHAQALMRSALTEQGAPAPAEAGAQQSVLMGDSPGKRAGDEAHA